jgi:hypothetical protein
LLVKVGIEMNLSQWFDHQLQYTLDGFIWAVQQLPTERLYAIPPIPEERLALPSMYEWLGGPPVSDTRTKQDFPSIEEMLACFEGVRHKEINLLPRFSNEAGDSKQKTTFWGDVSLCWLVCKTYQHTTEHSHDILSLMIFWDRRLERLAQQL